MTAVDGVSSRRKPFIGQRFPALQDFFPDQLRQHGRLPFRREVPP